VGFGDSAVLYSNQVPSALSTNGKSWSCHLKIEAQGFKKDIPYAVHIVWQTQMPEESTPVATPKLRRKDWAASLCPLRRELSSVNSPHLNQRERKGAATTCTLAWLKEEEEDKKVRFKSDDSLGCVLRKVVGWRVSGLSKAESAP